LKTGKGKGHSEGAWWAPRGSTEHECVGKDRWAGLGRSYAVAKTFNACLARRVRGAKANTNQCTNSPYEMRVKVTGGRANGSANAAHRRIMNDNLCRGKGNMAGDIVSNRGNATVTCQKVQDEEV